MSILSSATASSSSCGSPRISVLISLYISSFSINSSSNLNTFKDSSGSISSSSRLRKWVVWSSPSTRSKSSFTAGRSLNFSFLIWKSTSIMYWTLLSILPSCRIERNRSKIAFEGLGEFSAKKDPHSFVKATAISTPSSVTCSSKSVSSCKATISWDTL